MTAAEWSKGYDGAVHGATREWAASQGSDVLAGWDSRVAEDRAQEFSIERAVPGLDPLTGAEDRRPGMVDPKKINWHFAVVLVVFLGLLAAFYIGVVAWWLSR